jgi:hypothetical protein
MSGVVPARRLLRLSISVDLKSQIATSRAGLRHGPALAVWAVWLVALGLVVVGIATTLPTTTDAESIVTGLSGSVAAVSLATVGAILVTRLPRNRIGWLLWASGVLLGFSFAMTGPLVAGLPGAVWLLWLVNLTWLPPIVFVGVLLPLAYPTGHLPSPRWRSVVVIVVMAMTLTLIQAAFSPFSPGSAPPGMRNPLAVSGALASVLSLMSAAASLAAVVCFPLAAASLVVRYRRASGVERAQLRWFAAVAALIGVSFALGLSTSSATSGVLVLVSNVAWSCLFIGLALLPLAIGIAVLRYRLYEIDRLVSRSIGWGVLTVILGSVFVGLVLGLQTLLAPFTGSNELAVAASTLLVFSLFQPVRRRVQGLVDRRFNRARYDAQAAVDAFAERLRDEVDLEILQGSLLRLVEATLEPKASGLWLRES